MKKFVNGIMITLAVLAILAIAAIGGFMGFMKLGKDMGFIDAHVRVEGVNGTVVYDSDGVSEEYAENILEDN